MISKQLKMLPSATKAYGGALRTTRRGRGARPLSAKKSIHLTLRSTKAVGARSFRKNRQVIEAIVRKQAKLAQIRLIHWANVGNHLHLHLKLPPHAFHCECYKKFIRAVTELIARKTLGAERNSKAASRFWDLRPYTRVLTSWREYQGLTNYIYLNQLEARGTDRDLAREMLRPNSS